MIYIKYIGKRVNKNGTKVSWGLFFCEYCETYCERRLDAGKRSQSCGCVQYKLASEARLGQKRTEETRMKQSKSLKGKKRTEEQRKNISNAQKGKHLTGETRQKISKSTKGENNPMYGKNHTKESRNNISKTRIEKGVAKLEKNPSWQNGKSFEEYPIEFKQIKKSILERDEYKCQYPDCKEKHKRLHVHHIDFNKQNNNPENLITLGTSCHMKTNPKNKRQYYTEFYQTIMMGKLMECLL